MESSKGGDFRESEVTLYEINSKPDPSYRGFEKFRVICGNRGLNREVSSVSVIDAPDIYNWLQGGEILLTSGYIFKDNTEYLLELIEKIAKNGAAALFMKLGRFIDDMPDEVRIKADELSFPIVYMPFSFLRILQLGRKE